MAAVEVTISGVLYDKHNRTMQNVVLIGEASLTGLGIGGGPIIPPGQPPGSGGVPTHPIMLPGMPGWGDPHPAHPIELPPEKPVLPPDVAVPPPGSPPVLIPGAGPTHPIAAPAFIVVDYPGMGKVIVPQPLPADPTKRPPVAQR